MGINWPEHINIENISYFHNPEKYHEAIGANKMLDDCKQAYAQREEAKELAALRTVNKALSDEIERLDKEAKENALVPLDVTSIEIEILQMKRENDSGIELQAKHIAQMVCQKFGATKALSVEEWTELEQLLYEIKLEDLENDINKWWTVRERYHTVIKAFITKMNGA